MQPKQKMDYLLTILLTLVNLTINSIEFERWNNSKFENEHVSSNSSERANLATDVIQNGGIVHSYDKGYQKITTNGSAGIKVLKKLKAENDYNMQLPPCMNISVLKPEKPNDNQKHLVTIPLSSSDRSMTSDPVTLKVNSSRTTICHPLSPQLMTCSKRSFQNVNSALPAKFTLRNHTLTILGSDIEIQLGDYFLEQTDNRVILCQQQIRQKLMQIPRCNYLDIFKFEYHVLNNGSWQLKSNQHIINQPDMLTVAKNWLKVNICYPLDISFINCNKLDTMYPTEYVIVKNHSLYDPSDETYFSIGQYFIAKDGMAYVCNSGTNNYKFVADNILYVTCNSVSAVCLLLTVIYQWLTSKKLSNHVKSLLINEVTLCLANVANAINITVYPRQWEPHPIGSCYAIFAATYLGYMWAFFWLNVLSFDVWYSFYALHATKYPCAISMSNHRRYICYSIYAWTIPILFWIAATIVDRCKSFQKVLWIFPDIDRYCWFNNRRSQWVFYFAPLVFVMITNLLFFICTVVTLRYLSQEIAVARRRRNMEKFIVCLKLFIIMCLANVAEVLFWTFGEYSGYYVWSAEDAVTNLQGVAIFLVYICKRNTCKKIKDVFKGRTLADICSRPHTGLTFSNSNSAP